MTINLPLIVLLAIMAIGLYVQIRQSLRENEKEQRGDREQ